jgi:hypothetical protein
VYLVKHGCLMPTAIGNSAWQERRSSTCKCYNKSDILITFFFWHNSPTRARAASILRCLNSAQWHTTFGRTLLEGWLAHRRHFYLTKHTHTKQTDIHAPGGTQTWNSSNRALVYPPLRPLGRWDLFAVTLGTCKPDACTMKYTMAK